MSSALRAFPAQEPAFTEADVFVLNNQTSPAAWTTVDLSATVGVRKVLAIFSVVLGQGYTYGVRPYGSLLELSNGLACASSMKAGAGGDGGIIMTLTDSVGRVEHKGNTTINNCYVKLIGFIA